jgi:hypothetical protein
MPKMEVCSVMSRRGRRIFILAVLLTALAALAVPIYAQMIDNTQAVNPINAGINKSLAQEISAGQSGSGESRRS